MRNDDFLTAALRLRGNPDVRAQKTGLEPSSLFLGHWVAKEKEQSDGRCRWARGLGGAVNRRVAVLACRSLSRGRHCPGMEGPWGRGNSKACWEWWSENVSNLKEKKKTNKKNLSNLKGLG